MRQMDWKYRRGTVCSLIVSSFQEILNPILYRQCRLWKMELRKLPLLSEAPLQLHPTQGADVVRHCIHCPDPRSDPIPCVLGIVADPVPSYAYVFWTSRILYHLAGTCLQSFVSAIILQSLFIGTSLSFRIRFVLLVGVFFVFLYNLNNASR